MGIRALLIDDDKQLSELLGQLFVTHDISLAWANDGGSGLLKLTQETFDVVLLDVMMPNLSGLDVLKRIRARSQVPVIMLTAKGDETDRVVGLELGADDYLAKPFSARELVARIRALLRRTQGTQGQSIAAGPFVLDAAARTLSRAGETLDVTGLEFDLMFALVKRRGRVMSRDALLEEAGRDDVTVSERTIDVHISHLRQKIETDPKAPVFLKTVRGIGYVFTEKPSGET